MEPTTNPFSDPMAEIKLRNNPKTCTYLDDPKFLINFQVLRDNYEKYMPHVTDKRIEDALRVLQGVELDTASGEGEDTEPMETEAKRLPWEAEMLAKGEDDREQTVEEKLKEMERKAYINQDKSLAEKERGNVLFKEGRFLDAIKCYDEAIKRNPEDPKLYSNRAACYSKLQQFHLALKDTDQCIALDSKFVKAYMRKGYALYYLKDLAKARQAFQTALDLDPNNAEAQAGIRKICCDEDPEACRKAAMHDPEVQAILGAPAMQRILFQLQSQPETLKEHIKNPDIASKIQKLIESGFICLR